MSGKKKVQAKVLSQKMIAPDIYDLWLETELAEEAGAGQFVGVYPADKTHLLPRPISICEVDKEKMHYGWCIGLPVRVQLSLRHGSRGRL